MVDKKTNKRKKQDGRSYDFTLQWLVKKYGQKWEIWRQLAEEWITNQDVGTAVKLEALSNFLIFTSLVQLPSPLMF